MTPGATPATPPPAAGWVARWFSAPRHAVYLEATGGDPDRALALYEWNAQLGAGLLRDLAHLEVGLRNAYDRALSQHWGGRGGHWTCGGDQLFDAGRRAEPDKAAARADHRRPRSAEPPPGKVVAEPTFGFWRFLSAAKDEKSLWVPTLHTAFAARTSRQDVHEAMSRLNLLRNRVAHHEQLLLATPAQLAEPAALATSRAVSAPAAARLGVHLGLDQGVWPSATSRSTRAKERGPGCRT